MALVLTQQCLADGRKDIKEKGWICLHNSTLWHPSATYARVFLMFSYVLLRFFPGCWRVAGASTLDAAVESSCTCPVCQQQALQRTLKKRGGFHTPGLTQAAYFLKTTMTTLLCGAPELLGSTGLAPGLCGLEIISRLSPFTYKLIGLPHVPLFSVPLKFPGCFPTACFTHRAGIPPWGLLGGYGGGCNGVREKLSVYFLSLALGNGTTRLRHIFSVLAGLFERACPQEMIKFIPVHEGFCFSHNFLSLVLLFWQLCLF